MSRSRWRVRAGIAALTAALQLGAEALGATVPSGFVDEPYATGLTAPTAMQFAPDGRLFVCEQAGKLRVIKNGALLATPFVTLVVDASGERGLLGVAFHPDFETNGYVYVYYTTPTPTPHNRVSRFVANGDVAVPGSEQVIFELDPLSSSTLHNGGALHFGSAGRLYVAVGDNVNGANAETLSSLNGKLLRIDADGSIPTSNPFYAVTTGRNRAIWALGLRNPFTFAIRRTTGQMFINDVGQSTWEEINEGQAGSDYGWPGAEGPSDDPNDTDPVYYYGRADGCAITGGDFYDPPIGQFPTGYVGDYFFADYCGGWIRKLETSNYSATGFASGISSPVDLKVGPDGSLYYLARGSQRVGRIRYTATIAPTITEQPADLTVAVGQAATFTVGASGDAPLVYRWRRGGIDISGATAAAYTLSSAQLADDGALFDVVVSNSAGSATSDTARLTVTGNTQPTAAITLPVSGTTYAGGDLVSYAGSGNDAQDGVLPASAFTWWVDFHHDAHTHPHVLPISGSKTGFFTIPTIGETSSNVFYRIHLRVIDSGGLTRSVTRDVRPRTSTIVLDTNPTGLQLLLDGQPVATPYTFVGVVGIERTLTAVSPQSNAAGSWVFSAWSDGGARIHTISTPGTDTAYVATFVAQPAASLAIGNAKVIEGNTGTGSIVFPVSLSPASTSPVSAQWRTLSGSAKAGSDYTGASGTLTFAAGTTSRTVSVSVAGDDLTEPNEVFYVDLLSPVGASLADSRGIGTIVNDDGPGIIVFSASSYQKTEGGGYATITVKRSGGLAGGMTVRYATSNGTATAATDYTSVTGTLTFDAGVTTLSFQVPIINDTRDESSETVNLALSSPAGGAVLGTRSTAVLTIVDNDSGGTLAFNAATYSRNESGGSVTLKVVRTAGAASNVTVAYATGGGTATSTVDYVPTSGTLTFAAGQTSASFTVPLKGDQTIENDETIGLSLSNPTGGSILGSPATATVTIIDDD